MLLAPVDAHKFYVSLTDMQYNETSGRLEVSSKYFIDDLELALDLGPDQHIIMPMDDQIIFRLNTYLKKHLLISCDEKVSPLELLGYEIEDDVVWVYLESEKIPNFSEINVTASQLTDLFEQQQNIVHVSNGEVIQSLFLRKEQASGSLYYK
jgi:hypothetical protein